MKNNENNITGYIEGYYGRLLSWESRKLIIKSLSKNKMNTYFYAPKEDIYHRLLWRKKYSKEWRFGFKKFIQFGKINDIKVIAGIAPGLDFNFNELNGNSNNNKKTDFQFLLKKAKQLLEDGANSIALMLDDIPNDFKNKFGTEISEGTYHAILANRLAKKLGQKIFFVPRIYADELIKDDPFYLKDLSKTLNPKIKIFYCGKDVVARTYKNYEKIKKVLSNEIIIWDNFYANDYCPRRFFIGPTIGRENLKNILINPTGLIRTDLLILDLFGKSIIGKVSKNKWEHILNNHSVPEKFFKIKKYFLRPDFGLNPPTQSLKIKIEDIEIIDYLLWKWKGKLSREWYPFLFGLKQDLQINQKLLTSERIIKSQSIPLSEFLNKGELI
ncbi:protein O-GlcNAcase [Alphaproteobacteria bacterium]|nr:protein O-GlcNAcase [Alphaproteobacteria bacterium]MDC1085898.1 beta-N-acetylglucosaminidase domain-containing protein [Alphaproteobacteria bacterium]